MLQRNEGSVSLIGEMIQKGTIIIKHLFLTRMHNICEDYPGKPSLYVSIVWWIGLACIPLVNMPEPHIKA